MTRDGIVAVLDKWLEAVGRHDAPAIMSLYADDCVVESPLAAGTVQGRDANAEVFRAFFDAIPDVRFAADEPVVEGQRAVLSAMLSGTATGGLMGVASTGRPASVPIVHLFQFENGRIARERRVYDFTGLLVQMGVLKAKPA